VGYEVRCVFVCASRYVQCCGMSSEVCVCVREKGCAVICDCVYVCVCEKDCKVRCGD
jgi:hypothetical protein